MELATIHVSGVNAKVVQKASVPKGIVGGYVDVIFDDDWKGLHRTAVIQGAVTLDILDVGDRFQIPQEAVAESGVRLKIGFYGVGEDGRLGIPTLWADLGVVQDAADPSGDEAADPALPIWAQIQARIGDLNDLDTQAKETLVTAINEVLTKGGSVDPEAIQAALEKYLEENPIETGATAEQAAQIQQNKEDIEKLSTGKLDATELPTAINEALALAKASGEFKGEPGQPGKDYMLTPADKTEIAEMAAELVDVPSGTLLPETEISQQGRVQGFGYKSVSVGEKVAVIMDGKPYITTHRVDGEGADAIYWIGNIAMFTPEGAGTEYGTGEPFFAQLFDSHSTFFFADGASHKVAICTVDVLDEVYVNALNSLSDSASGNFIVEMTTTDGENFTANKTYEEIVTAWGDGLCVLAMMAGEPITVPLTGMDIEKGDLFFEMSAGIFEGVEMTAVLTCSPGNEWSLIQKAIPTMETVERLAGELMTGVAKVPTAEVGQTIKVKSVDDNGVPTAWEAVDFPSGGGGSGEAWDVLANFVATEDIAQFTQTTPPVGHNFAEYNEVVALLFVTPNAGGFTTGIRMSLNGINSWAGNFAFPIGGNKTTADAGQLAMLHVRKTDFGWIPENWFKSYNTNSINNNLSQVSGTTLAPVMANFAANYIPGDMTNVLYNYPVSAIAIGGYQAVLGAGSKAIVYGKRKA